MEPLPPRIGVAESKTDGARLSLGGKALIPKAGQALPGRPEAMPVLQAHPVNGHPITAHFPEGVEVAAFGLGCFLGAERKFRRRRERLVPGQNRRESASFTRASAARR